MLREEGGKICDSTGPDTFRAIERVDLLELKRYGVRVACACDRGNARPL
jgi:hypothetical protein